MLAEREGASSQDGVRVLVWVVFLGELAIRRLELLVCGRFVDSQKLIQAR